MNKPSPEDTAAQCRHYAMCKIDYLGTGLCPAGRHHHFVSHYPQGRMDIYAALAGGKLPVTRGLVEIAAACTICGICDMQCHFATQLRPLPVVRALKEYVANFLETGQPVDTPADSVLVELRGIVGEKWATNDPAHCIAYAADPCPVSVETLPRWVVLPTSTREVSEIMKIVHREKLEYAVRGNGSSVMGFVLSPGLVMDTARLDTLEFDAANWCVRVGAGVSAFALQKAARARGFRVNAAEPAALYCANIMCSGIFSLFSSSYGTAADNILDAEFVTPEGGVFRLGEKNAPNLYAFEKADLPQPGICTEAVVRLHPVTDDESAVAVPFADLPAAIRYARELNQRGIGIGIGILGGEYLSTFTAPSRELARSVKDAFSKELGIAYLVIVLGDRFALDAARELAPTVIETEVMRTLILGMPALVEKGILDILQGLEGEKPPYELLAAPGMLPLIEAALDPGAEKLASVVDPDLIDAYRDLYERPEMTDMLWLNTFRIVSARMGRDGHVVAFIVYVPLDDEELIEELHLAFARVARENRVRGDFGFLTPLDRGRMAVLEWDMYLDHTDPGQVVKMQQAMAETGRMITEFSHRDPRVLWIRYVFNQGFSRKESFLYHGARRE